MTHFPETQHSLILRLGIRGSESDWSQFLADYWSPLCRFAARWGKLHLDEAEDVASSVVEAVIANGLLSKWSETKYSKLRTFLCSVVRNVISNRAKVKAGRERIQHDQRDDILAVGAVTVDDGHESPEVELALYAAWVDELLQESLQSLSVEYFQTGRADCFRVLYGRVCDLMNNKEVAAALNLRITEVENHYKRARDQLKEHLRSSLENRVVRYSKPEDVEDEILAEWQQLGEFLQQHGGLEEAIRRSYELSSDIHRRESISTVRILRRLHDRSQIQ